MTKASRSRVTKRQTKKVGSEAPPEGTTQAGGNGQSAAPVNVATAQKPQGKVVGKMKPTEAQKLRDSENEILRMLAEIGDITIQIEQARAKQGTIAQEVGRKRQDFQALMRGVVISHGHDPDNQKFHLDVKDGSIRQLS